MACKLATNCIFLFGFFSCNLPEDTIDMDLKVHTLWGIHTYKRDRNIQVIKCRPWGSEVKPFPSLQRKIMGDLRQRQTITTPFANRSYQPRPKATPVRRHNLVTLSRPHKYKLSNPRKINVGYHPNFMQRNWLTMVRAKEAEAAKQAPTPAQPVMASAKESAAESLAIQSPKYCAICTPLGKLFPVNIP